MKCCKNIGRNEWVHWTNSMDRIIFEKWNETDTEFHCFHARNRNRWIVTTRKKCTISSALLKCTLHVWLRMRELILVNLFFSKWFLSIVNLSTSKTRIKWKNQQLIERRSEYLNRAKRKTNVQTSFLQPLFLTSFLEIFRSNVQGNRSSGSVNYSIQYEICESNHILTGILCNLTA